MNTPNLNKIDECENPHKKGEEEDNTLLGLFSSRKSAFSLQVDYLLGIVNPFTKLEILYTLMEQENRIGNDTFDYLKPLCQHGICGYSKDTIFLDNLSHTKTLLETLDLDNPHRLESLKRRAQDLTTYILEKSHNLTDKEGIELLTMCLNTSPPNFHIFTNMVKSSKLIEVMLYQECMILKKIIEISNHVLLEAVLSTYIPHIGQTIIQELSEYCIMKEAFSCFKLCTIHLKHVDYEEFRLLRKCADYKRENMIEYLCLVYDPSELTDLSFSSRENEALRTCITYNLLSSVKNLVKRGVSPRYPEDRPIRLAVQNQNNQVLAIFTKYDPFSIKCVEEYTEKQRLRKQ